MYAYRHNSTDHRNDSDHSGLVAPGLSNPAAFSPRSRLGRAVSLAIGAGVLLVASLTDATTITAVATCDPCGNITQMTLAATTWANANASKVPYGTVFLMSSLNAPLSGFFRSIWTFNMLNHTTHITAQPITTTNADLAALDNQIFSRAAKLAPVTVPLAYTASDTEIEDSLINQIAWVGSRAADDLHWLGADFPVVGWFAVSLNGGPPESLFIGDIITVVYGTSGFSERWMFVNMGPPSPFTRGQPIFKRVGPLMYHNRPYTQPSSSPAKPVTGQAGGANSWPNGQISLLPDSVNCFGNSSITITSPDGSTSWNMYGIFVYPC